MQALNHVAFGTLIAVTLKQPILVAPLALASHFALDMLPHYGEDPRARLGTAFYHFRVLFDGIFSMILVAYLSIVFSEFSNLIVLSAFLAILPDLFWPLALYIKNKQSLLWKFFKFHKGIQKFENPRGFYFEIIWFVTVIVVLIKLS